MSKTVITAEMVGDPHSPLIGMTLLEGDDRIRVGTVFDSVEDAEVVKSLRLPKSMYEAARAKGHPQGFSGVVREALQQYLNDQPTKDDVRHALNVLHAALDNAA